jgi:hypothetical protein
MVTRLTIAVALCLLAAGCAEKPQTSGTRKADTQAFQGGTNDGYAAPGWKAGDAASWEQQLKTRAQGQNEYSRASAQ